MAIKKFQVPFSGEDLLDVELVIVSRRIQSFVLNYRALIDETWREVARYDTTHGPLHVHRFYETPDDPGRRVAVHAGQEPTAAFQRLKADLERNWKKYRARLEARQNVEG